MAKKAAKKPSKKASKKSKVERLPKSEAAGIGHNKGQINKDVEKQINSYMRMEEDKKQISKAQRDIKANLKEKHGILSSVLSHEIRMRKMEAAARVQFEQGHADLKDMLGYQFTLPIMEGEDEDADSGEAEGGDDAGFGDSEEEAA